MCKSVFSFLRQLTTWHYSHPAAAARLLLTAGRTSIDRSPDPQQQTRSRGVRRPDETYGRTDRRRTYARPLHRLCSEYDAGCANEGNYSIISSRPTSVLRILYCVRKYPTCFIFFICNANSFSVLHFGRYKRLNNHGLLYKLQSRS